MRRAPTIAGLAAVLASLYLVIGAAAASPDVTYESQAWWRRAGITVPGAVGSHIHLLATVPRDGRVVDGIVNVPVTITAHDQAGSITELKYQDGDGTVHEVAIAPLGPCHDCTASYTVPVNFGAHFATGRRELRIRAENNDEDPTLAGAQRMFTTFNAQVCVRSCSPTYRPGPWVEARAWYVEGHEYENARFLSTLPDGPVPASWTFTVELKSTKGPATTLGVAAIDPSYHAGNGGTELPRFTGKRTLTVDTTTLTPGAHSLVLISSDGQNAAVLRIPFTVGGAAPSSSPTPTPSPTPTASPTPTPLVTPSPTPTPTPILPSPSSCT